MRTEPDRTGKPVTIATDPGRLEFVVALKPDRRAPPPRPDYDRPQS
jgi:hypothetical protein